MKTCLIGLAAALAFLPAAAQGAAALRPGEVVLVQKEVEAATKPGQPWTAYPTRTLSDLPASVRDRLDRGLNRYGSRTARRAKATGFFRVEKVDGRWWLVDPEGALHLQRGVTSVRPPHTPGGRQALEAQFKSTDVWAARSTGLLREHGFSGLGAWSDTVRLRAVAEPLPYTRIWNFMSAYGKQRGGTFQASGHTGYPRDAIFVFDPEFPAFCEAHARQLTETKDDPWLLGHFSDNELPFKVGALKGFLGLPEGDPGRRASERWLLARKGVKALALPIVKEDERAFAGYLAETYFRIVSQAMRRADPNHLLLGCRFHGAALRLEEVFRAAAGHVDVVSVNWYRAWTPDPQTLALWERVSGRPCLVTEFYAKGADAGMGNTSGAGWLVRTQADRGRFYQHFALGLLESKVCVGWQWFRYMDNDPADTEADPSNADANKGIVDARFKPYLPLLEAMRELNARVYGVADHFDGRHPVVSGPGGGK